MAKTLELISQTFGNLTVIEFTGRTDPAQGRIYHCLCGCGKEKEVATHQLTLGSVQSCGCWRSKIVEVGKRYGRLTALARAGHVGRSPAFLFRCDCGVEKVIDGGLVKRGNIKSCGCFRREHCLEISKLSPGRDGKSLLRQQFLTYKSNAKRGGREFTLTQDQFEQITAETCVYCGASPQMRSKSRHASYSMNGIDRRDNNQGYVLVNCVPCCSTCNVAKASMSFDEFKAWISMVYQKIVVP